MIINASLATVAGAEQMNGSGEEQLPLLRRLNDNTRVGTAEPALQRISGPDPITAQAIFGPLLPLGWLT